MHKKPLKPIIRYIFGDFAFEKHFDRFVFLVCMPILCLVSFSISCSHFSLSARFVCRFLYWRSMQECLLGNSIIFNFDAACVCVFLFAFLASDSGRFTRSHWAPVVVCAQWLLSFKALRFRYSLLHSMVYSVFFSPLCCSLDRSTLLFFERIICSCRLFKVRME